VRNIIDRLSRLVRFLSDLDLGLPGRRGGYRPALAISLVGTRSRR
jgi:hypothetical protein